MKSTSIFLGIISLLLGTLSVFTLVRERELNAALNTARSVNQDIIRTVRMRGTVLSVDTDRGTFTMHGTDWWDSAPRTKTVEITDQTDIRAAHLLFTDGILVGIAEQEEAPAYIQTGMNVEVLVRPTQEGLKVISVTVLTES